VTFDAFRERAAGGGLVPVWQDVLLDHDTPVSAFAKLRREPFAFLLESAPAGSETWSRYTFMGTEPRGAWRLVDGVVEEWSASDGWHARREPDDPLADLEACLARHPAVPVPELTTFWGGAVGYFGYDVVRAIERLPDPPPRAITAPDALFVFTRAVVIVDNLLAQARVVVGVPVRAGVSDRELRGAYDAATQDISGIVARLRSDAPLPALVLNPSRDAEPIGTSRYERERFLRDVERIREYIMAGDCFQALLARRITVPHDFSGASLYRALRALNPSPYMFHMLLDGVELVGSSPELLVRLDGERVTVRPIAGTRWRGRTPAEDAALSTELLADEKERAEHVMLVDLGRNDVGRVARYGSVEVTELMAIERYSHVMHIVSQVEGLLRDGLSAIDVLRATFPAGTMTGAPKVRAMEIIDELEPERRGPYAGAVGYIGVARDDASGTGARGARMDLAITIRTCVIADGEASVQAGAGIVADSVPEREWEETGNKARAMLTAIAQVRPGR
jgi:anthranilate synthase component 1